jgi:uncharacterized membrane protein
MGGLSLMHSSSNNKQFIPISVLLFAFVLRMWDIDARSLWFDESIEYWSATADLKFLPLTIKTSFQPPLYTYLLHFWLNFGEEAIWLRFLSVVFSILSLAGIMNLSYRVFGLSGALVSGIVMAVLPPEVKYAQEIGEYALMGFALTWVLLALYRTFEVSTWKSWGLWCFFALLAIYSHYGTSITIIALSALAFFDNAINRYVDKLIKQASIAIWGLVLCTPLLYFLPKQISAYQQCSSIKPFASFYSEILKFIVATGETFLFHLIGWPFSTLPKFIGLIAVWSVLLISIIAFLDKNKSLRQVIICFWAVYMAYYLMVRTSLYAYGNYGFRYALVLLPLFVLIITVAILWLSQFKRAFLFASGILLLFIVALGSYSLPNRTLSEVVRGNTAWPETQDMREVIQYWAKQRNQNDPTYVYYGAVPAFRYYARLYGIEPKYPLPPTWYSNCWKQISNDYCISNNIFYGAWIRSYSQKDKLLSIQMTLGSMPEKFWIVFSHVYPNEESLILGKLSEIYSVEFKCQKTNAAVYLLTME